MTILPSNPASGATRKAFSLASAGLGIYAAGRSSGYRAGKKASRRNKRKGNSGTSGKTILFWIVVFLIILAFFHP